MKDSRKVHTSIQKNKRMDPNPTFPSKLSERKAIEKNRRDQMKALYCNLCSLIPRQSSKEVVSLSDQIGEAANYIKELQERLEVMKQKKKSLKARKSADLMSSNVSSDSEAGELKLPRIEIHSNGSTLDVVLITGLQHRYLFKETVGILHEEGADVVSAGFSVVDQAVFHTLCYQIGGSEFEYEAARISERLRKFVADDN